MQSLRFPSPAKLNLFLYITGRRSDGYHELQTLFQFLDKCDYLTIKLRYDGKINLKTPLPTVSLTDNLIYKAAKALQDSTKTSLGVDISLEKNLPIGGGVGGGSSNAATTLVALNYLWDTKLNAKDLANIGVKLGADVPIFIHGKTAFAEGIGEKIMSCHYDEKYYLVIQPNVHIATSKIFNDPNLKRNTPTRTLSELLTRSFENDCVSTVIKHYPEVEDWLNWLVKYKTPRLTGTGACIFSEFDSYEEAKKVLLKVPNTVTTFIAKGCNTSPLYKFLLNLQPNYFDDK